LLASSEVRQFLDNDPIVKTQAGSMGDYLEADLRDPARILEHAAGVLDLSQPVGLLLVAVLHFLPDDAQALGVVRQLVSALPPGSYLVASNLTLDHASAGQVAKHEELAAAGRTDARPRTALEFGRFFDRLELVPPGIAPVSEWRRTEKERPTAQDVAIYGAVGRRV
jgi:hypothetical protein